MDNRNLMLKTKIGKFHVMSCQVSDAMSVGYEMLQADPCVFLESDFYTTI